MFWTLELASHLEDAPWPASKDELIDCVLESDASVIVTLGAGDISDFVNPLKKRSNEKIF